MMSIFPAIAGCHRPLVAAITMLLLAAAHFDCDAATASPSAAGRPVAAPPRISEKLLTVDDFGAKGDAVTDDTQAFRDYTAYLRKQAVANLPQRAWVLGFGRVYNVSDSIDLTGFQFFLFQGNGSQIRSRVREYPAIDAAGTGNSTFENLHIWAGAPGGPENAAICGLQIGLISNSQPEPSMTLFNVHIDGWYSQAALVNHESEIFSAYDLRINNRYDGPEWAYCVIEDGIGHWPFHSKYIKNTRSVDVFGSFNENVFDKADLENTGNGPVVWMSGATRHAYRRSYMASFTKGAPVPIAVICTKFKAGPEVCHGVIGLEWDVHSETSPSSVFLFSGSPRVDVSGLFVNDHLVQAGHLFASDAGVTSVKFCNTRLDVPNWFSPAGAKQTVFDKPELYTFQGDACIHNRYHTVWNAPAQFVGRFRSDKLEGFAFGPGSYIAEDYDGSRITTGTLDAASIRGSGPVIFNNLPASASGLAPGQLWNNHGVLSIAPGDGKGTP